MNKKKKEEKKNQFCQNSPLEPIVTLSDLSSPLTMLHSFFEPLTLHYLNDWPAAVKESPQKQKEIHFALIKDSD